ncbi:MAG: hypothetical protein ACSNEK_09525 [Parachlamydiaceae bacterium]
MNYFYWLIGAFYFLSPCIVHGNEKIVEQLSDDGYVAHQLADLDDSAILSPLAKGPLLTSCCWAASILQVDSDPFFVKLVPLNELEEKLHHIQATENLPGSPFDCQSHAWTRQDCRDLAAYLLRSDYDVLKAEGYNFSLTGPWHTTEVLKEKLSPDLENLTGYVNGLDNPSVMEATMSTNHPTSTYGVIFIGIPS